MNTYVVELRRKAIEARNVGSQVHAAAAAEGRGFNEAEQRQWDQAMAQAEQFNADADAAEQREQRLQSVQAPMLNTKTKLGDSEESAMAYYIRTADYSAIRESRASNNTGMNVGTAADGGNAVPTGHFTEIISRRDEQLLANKLGVRRIAGVGTTVNVPIDDEADGEFVTTAEQADANNVAFDRDAPAIGTVAMTLVKKTKKIELTDELLADTDTNLLQFVAEFVGRGMAKTHNDMLVTAALAGGTAAKTFASASTIAASEIPDLWYALPDYYATDEASVGWVTRRATEGVIRSLAGTTNFYYAPTPGGTTGMQPALWGAPLYNSGKVAAIAASAKSLLLGNWFYMGLREAPGLTVLRDPYTVEGKVVLKYYFRAVYAVLQAGAIVYGTHPTA